MNKKFLITILVIIVVGGGAFYGGMIYGKSKVNLAKAFQNMTPEQRQQLFQANVGSAASNFQGRNGRGTGVNFLLGEVIAKDDKSLTLKMQDGSSKIVFFSDSTTISKTTDGSLSDIEIGKQVSINGQQNSDGSYTANTIQLSPRAMVSGNNQ